MVKTTLEDIEIFRNDTLERSITFKNSNGDIIDITGWTVWFTVREIIAGTSTSSDANALISKSYTGTSSGIISLTLTKDETNKNPSNYYYDIQYKKLTGGIKTVGVGNFIINSDVTRST